MAVKLILVLFMVLTISESWAQQSSQTGSSDRRISLRRFSSRNKVENTRNTGRVKASADILEKRKQLFQRNPSRARNLGRSKQDSGRTSEARENVRLRTTKTTQRTTTTESYVEIEPPVENISNNDEKIRDLVLDNQIGDEEIKTPFKGVSEVRTVSSPSGFRSSNEQIFRVSFKKTTTSSPEIIDNIVPDVIEKVKEEEQEQRIRRPLNKSILRQAGRRLGVRRRGQKPTTPRRIVTENKSERFKGKTISDPLKALLKTASEDDAVNDPPVPNDIEAAIKEMKEDNMIEKDVDIEAAIREMKEDNGKEEPRAISQATIRRRPSGERRVNISGRSRQRQRTNKVTEKSVSRLNNFRSFPARKNIRKDTPRRIQAVTPTTESEQRIEARPTVTPTQERFPTAKIFQDLEFTTPIQQNQFITVTEAPRSSFQLEQNFGSNLANEIIQQPQPRITQQEPSLQQTQQRVLQSNNLQPAQQFVQTQTRPQPKAPVQITPQFVEQRTFPTPRLEPIQQFSQTSQSVQSVPQPQAVPTSSQQFQGQPLALPQNSLNLLNTNNFQAFDAQFGGSVPTNPGASQLSSSIFTQPGTSLLQGRDVLVSPQNNFQTIPIQSGQVLRSASSPSSPNVPQFNSQNVPAPSFSGHPANGINLQTGAFNLRTG